MSIKLKGGGSAVLRGAALKDFGVSLTYKKVNVHVSGGTFQNVVDADANMSRYTEATFYSGGAIVVSGAGPAFTLLNKNPEVATINADGTILRVAGGVCNLVLEGPINVPLTLDLLDKTGAVGQPDEFLSTVAGSLAEHCQQQIDSRIDNTMTMAVNGKVFSTQDHTTPSYVRNPNLWCADVDLTCISPWNSLGGVTRAGTLITPRHLIGAAHYEVNVGNTIRFVAQDGTVHNKTITGKRRHPDYAPYYPDLNVYTLDSDLPVIITPCKVMPSDWNSYLVQNYHNRPPALGLDQEEKALIIDFNVNGSFLTPTNADRLIFHEIKIPGDSGNSAFLIANGELVLVTVWTYGGAGSGTPVASYIPDINQMIVDADIQAGVSTVADPTWPNANGHYQVKPADFSAFPNYA